MSDATRKALDRLAAIANRPARRRPGGFSTAPLVVAGAMTLGYHLLVRLVPRLWAEVLPGGFEQGAILHGWPRVVWRLAWACHLHFPMAVACVAVVSAVAFVFGRRPLTRPLAWLTALGTIGLDAAILFVAIKAGMDAQGISRMLP